MTEHDTYVLPASLNQHRLWLLDQLAPGGATYNIAWVVRLEGDLDRPALEAALGLLVARHESLRTHFTAVDGEPRQVIVPPAPVRLGTAASVAEVAREPFDLATGPLTRFVLLADGRLAVVVHHAVADGWSFGLLFAELATAYAAYATGTEPDLPPVPVQYGDFAIWQRDQAGRGAFDDDLAYWHRELSGAPTLLDLPADRPRPAEQTDAGGLVRFTVPSELAARLRAYPLFSVLLAGFQSLLHRLSGQDDLLVAVPVAARTRPQTRDVAGFFANTLALRATIGPGTTFAGVLAAARASATAAQTRQEAPFEQLVDRLGVPRGLAHPPLVQVMFAVDEPPPARTAAGLRIVPELWENGTVKFDLTLTVEDRPDGLTGRITYRTDLFDRVRIERLAAQYVTLLKAALEEPDTPVAALPLLRPDEETELLRQSTGDPLPLPAATLTELFAKLDGDGVAVGALTYRELDERADKLAHLLREHGVTADVPVGLHLGRSADLVTAILAVWRAGGGYLPLDPALPAARLETMVAAARPPVVVTDGPTTMFPSVLRLDEVGWDTVPRTRPPGGAHPESLAYLLYTSGSTGEPKGVAVPHRALVDLLAGFDRLLGLTPADRVAAITTAAFDISVVELVLPLLAGARIELIDADTARDAVLLRAALADRGITVAQGTPATWRMLVTAGGVPDTVRLRISGGEALPRDLADRLRGPGITLINGYGPSETTVYSTAGPVGAHGPVSLGRPTPNTRVHLLDPAGRPVPAGATGEIHLGGPGVARGYLGQAGATAARFRPDPYEPGARLYASGDLARRLPDGTLAYLGRADRQLKVRGFRIEPGEIETLLRARDGIDDAVPAALVVLDTFPRTGSGKIDRAALPEPVWRSGEDREIAPEEQQLAELWAEVLGLPAVGAHDNFFALGGHSLTAARLIARIRAVLGADVTLRDLFAAPTVAELAPLIGTAGTAPETAATTPDPDRLPASLDDLSDAEIDALLDLLTTEEDSA